MTKLDENFKRVGTGGMSKVYAGFHPQLGRKVAIKKPLDEGGDYTQTFFAEAGKMAQVDHPSVMRIFQVEIDEETRVPQIVMEWADGGSLREKVERGPTPPREAAEILRQALLGLRAIHEKGIIHRDIKPGNIFLSGGLCKIGDFGIAKISEEHTSPYVTWKYAAPEQLQQSGLAASDIYSLGLVAYEVLLGEDGFHGLIRKIWGRLPSLRRPATDEMMKEEPTTIPWQTWAFDPLELPPPHDFDSAIPVGLSRVVWRMARKDAHERYVSCGDVLRDLDATLGYEEEKAPTLSLEELLPTVALEDLPSIGEEAAASPPAGEKPWDTELSADPSSGEDTEAVADPQRRSVPPPPPAGPGSFESGNVHLDWRPEPLPERQFPLKWALAVAAVLAIATVAVLRFLPDRELAERRERGRELLGVGDHQAAAAIFAGILAERPEDREAILGSAKANYHLSNFGEVRRLLEDLLDRAPGEPEAHLYLGQVDLAQNRDTTAIDHLRRVTENASERFPKAHFYLGFALYRQRSFAAARAQFERFLELEAGEEALEERSRQFLKKIGGLGISENLSAEPGSAYGRGLVLDGFRRASVRLDKFEGRVLLLHLWATWCAPCLREIPSLARFHADVYPDLEKQGLSLVTVSNDYVEKDLERFADAVLADAASRIAVYWDPNHEVNEALNLSSSLPQTVLIDRRGQVVEVVAQTLDWQSPSFLKRLEQHL